MPSPVGRFSGAPPVEIDQTITVNRIAKKTPARLFQCAASKRRDLHISNRPLVIRLPQSRFGSRQSRQFSDFAVWTFARINCILDDTPIQRIGQAVPVISLRRRWDRMFTLYILIYSLTPMPYSELHALCGEGLSRPATLVRTAHKAIRNEDHIHCKISITLEELLSGTERN